MCVCLYKWCSHFFSSKPCEKVVCLFCSVRELIWCETCLFCKVCNYRKWVFRKFNRRWYVFQWFVLFSLTELFKSIVGTRFVTNVTMGIQHFFWKGDGERFVLLWNYEVYKNSNVTKTFPPTASRNKVVTIIQLQRESLPYLDSGFGFSLISSNVNKRIARCSCEFYTGRDLNKNSNIHSHTHVNRWVNYKNC